MIGRLGISTGIGGQPAASSSTTTSRGSITSASSGMMSIGSSSMPSLSGFSTGFSNMTKKVTESLSGDAEKKAKDDRKLQISQAVQMIEDISLQCPSTHLGLVLAYTGSNSSPVIHPGLKFTWFRMRGQDHIDQVEESQRAWYAPSVDDIGCTICVQCEDNFDQGLSRYLECGPLQTDPLLRSTVESAISGGFYEAKGLCVSLGLSESEASSTTAGMVVDGSTIPIIPAPDPMALHTTLSKEHAFLQLNGRCTVEIDDQGIFISIPTFHSAARLSQHQHRHNDGIGRATFNTSRRGMRLPVSTQMKVSCASTSSLVLSVPLMQSQGPQSQETMEKAPLSPTGADDESSSAFVSPTKAPTEGNEDIDVVDVNTRESANNTTSEDAAMRDFLSSSILSIPWTYEGHNLSPEAYINGLGNKLSPEEREKLLKEAEEDSMIFAQTVVALTEFIACVPEGSKELLLCFSCADRLTRDSVVLSLRSLACKPLHTSRYERRRVLPWMSMEEDETTVLQQMSDSAGNAATGEFPDSTWKRRLKAVEEEAAALKRERNELTKQLLETKEELFVTKQKMQKASKPNDHPVGNISLSNSSVHSAAGSTTELPLTHRSMHSEDDSPCFASSEVAETATVPTSLPREEEREDIAIITDSRQLQHKLIELENKLSIATKREQESSCQREEIEQQNAKLSAELEATKRKKVDARDKLSTLQSLHDQQSLMMRKMDQEIDSLRDVVSCIAAKDSQISQFQKEIVSLQERNNYLQAEISLLKTENGETKDLVQKQLRQIEQLEVDHSAKVLSLNNSVRHLEQQLSDFMLENKRQEREILQQKETINKQTQELQKVKSLEMQLKEAHEERDSIQAELNHLQKKNDSIAKDLKRVIKENAQSISEFEKALIRKSGECDELYFQLLELREMENARMQATANEDSAGAAIIARISSVLSNSNAQSSTHSNGGSAADASNNNATNNTGNSTGVSSRMSNIFRRMSSSSAVLFGNNVASGSQEDASEM